MAQAIAGDVALSEQELQDSAESKRKRLTIGVLLNGLYDDYPSTILSGVRAELEPEDVDVICVAGGVIGAAGRESRAKNLVFDLVGAHRFDGLVLLSGPLGDRVGVDGLRDYCRRFEPLPMCSISIPMPGVPSLVVDNTSGLREVISHLIEVHHCRRLVFIRGPELNDEAELRFSVYRKVLADHDIPFDPELVVPGDFSKRAGARAIAVLCDERRVRFDAIVGANDYLALGAQEALLYRRVRVPQDVAIVGFDDVGEARFASPPLTTVNQSLFEQGSHAARVVLARCRGEDVPERTVLETSVVLRQSCGCVTDGRAHRRSMHGGAGPESLTTFIGREREALCEVLRDSLPPVHSRIEPGWPDALLDALDAEVSRGSSNLFISTLDDLLRRAVEAGASARAWQAPISALRSACLPELTAGSRDWMAAEDVFHQARVLIGDISERAQAQHRIAIEGWIHSLRETGEALATTLDVRAAMKVLIEHLPSFLMRACAVSLFDRDATRTTARLSLAYDAERSLDMPDEGVPFPSRDLAPPGYLPDRRVTLVVEPLYFKDEALGFAVFEMGTLEGRLFEGLREQISAALKGAHLVDQLIDEATRRQRAESERLAKEMEIAQRIQTTILPRSLNVSGLSIAAVMVPATEVGGDYYDVNATSDGAWIGIGDVAGHGLQTGLVMLMIQSVVASLVRKCPEAPPHELVRVLNAVLHDNVRHRLQQDEHATLALLRYDRSGRIVFAGGHEDLIVYRAATARCEIVSTLGPWVGAVPELGAGLVDRELTLDDGDVLLLYTDGITEAKGPNPHERFGLEPLAAELERVGALDVKAIRDRLLERVRSFMSEQEDDMTLVVIRHRAR